MTQYQITLRKPDVTRYCGYVQHTYIVRSLSDVSRLKMVAANRGWTVQSYSVCHLMSVDEVHEDFANF